MISEKTGSVKGIKYTPLCSVAFADKSARLRAENYKLIDLYGDIFYLFLDRSDVYRLIVLPKNKYLSGGKSMDKGVIYARFSSQSQNEQSIRIQSNNENLGKNLGKFFIEYTRISVFL